MFLRLMALPRSSSWYAEVAVPPVGPSCLGRSCVWYVLEFLLYIWVWSLASLVFLSSLASVLRLWSVFSCLVMGFLSSVSVRSGPASLPCPVLCLGSPCRSPWRPWLSFRPPSRLAPFPLSMCGSSCCVRQPRPSSYLLPRSLCGSSWRPRQPRPSFWCLLEQNVQDLIFWDGLGNLKEQVLLTCLSTQVKNRHFPPADVM